MKRPDLTPMRAIVTLDGTLSGTIPGPLPGVVLKPKNSERFTEADIAAADARRPTGERIAAPRRHVNAAMHEPLPPSQWPVTRKGAEDFRRCPSLGLKTPKHCMGRAAA